MPFTTRTGIDAYLVMGCSLPRTKSNYWNIDSTDGEIRFSLDINVADYPEIFCGPPSVAAVILLLL